MKPEIVWKPIVGYEDCYEVSNIGKIRSIDRIIGGNRNRIRKGQLISPQHSASGYLQVRLCKFGKSKTYKVHRLVAQAFIPNPDNKPCVDHKNTNRKDNRECNLRWVTPKENSNNPLSKQHAKNGTIKETGENKRTCGKFKESVCNTPKNIYCYNLSGVFLNEFQSMIEAEYVTKVEMSGIRKALNKTYKSAGGYLWRTEKLPSCEPYKRRRHSKCKITQMLDNKGNVIKEWKAIRDAAKELGTTHTRIIRYIPIDGYFFRYI